MVWGKAGSTTVNSGDDCDITSMTASTTSQIITSVITSGNTYGRLLFNDDSGTGSGVYNRRGNSNGGTTFTGRMTEIENTHDTATDKFTVSYVCDVSGEDKLQILSYVDNGTDGANSPNRMEFVFKYSPTSASTITRVDLFNTTSGDFTTGTNLTVLGSDITTVAVVDAKVQNGAIFEETDTNKHYLLDDGTWTEI